MIITLELTSAEAEDLMFACKLRARQVRCPFESPETMARIRQAIEEQAIAQGVWSGPAMRWPIEDNIRVTITMRNRW